VFNRKRQFENIIIDKERSVRLSHYETNQIMLIRVSDKSYDN